MSRPKLLFLTRAFPPGAGVGAVRTWNLAKYLSRQGWDVSVVTPHPSLWRRPDNPEKVARDVEREGIRLIFTGHRWRSLTPELKCWNERAGWVIGGICRRIARRLSIDRGIGWIKAAERACSHLTAEDVDLILASGPPFSGFVLAKRLSDRLGRPYVMDYRDPWTGKPHRPLPDRVRRQEERLLQGAAAVTIVSPTWARVLTNMFHLDRKVHVITNGFDPEDAQQITAHRFDHFAIVYAGTFYPPRRVITPLMAALSQLKGHSTRWYFHYYGRHQSHVGEEAAKYGLADRVIQHGYVPRKQCLSATRGASVAVVINPVNPQPTAFDLAWIPAKLFEILALGTPLLFIGATEGDAADIVRQTGEGGVFTAQNVNGIASFLSGLMDTKTISASGCDAYSSPNLATKLDRVLRMSAGMLSPTKNSVQVFGDNAGSPVEHIHGTVKETNASK